jgi:4-aminobutyrate aminotransferase-like enzyme
VLDAIEEEQLCERSQRIGARMIERLKVMKKNPDSTPIGDVRGLGAMVAFELVKERGGHVPDPDKLKLLTAKALEHGLILLSCGIYGNTLRLLTPLTIPDAQLEEGLDILERSLTEIA